MRQNLSIRGRALTIQGGGKVLHFKMNVGGKVVRDLLLYTIIISVFIGKSILAAPNWQATLLGSDRTSPLEPSPILTIQLPPEADASSNLSLIIELDNVDVTDLVSRQAEFIVYVPVEALANGEHVLKFYEISIEGDLIERGIWTFETVGGTGVASGETGSIQIDGNNNLEVSRRLVDHKIRGQVDSPTMSGSGYNSIETQHVTEYGSLHTNSTANYFLESKKDISVTGRTLDLGEYNSIVEYGNEIVRGGVAVGHQDIGYDSLLMSNFNRRGLSVNGGTADDTVSATAFSLSSDNITGAADIFGQQDQSGYVRGGALTAKPLDNDIGKLELSTLFYRGEGGLESAGVSSDPFGFSDSGESNVPDGYGWGLIANSSWLDDRLKIRGDYAFASTDIDGSGVLDDDEATARSIEASYVLVRDQLWNDEYTQVSIGGQWEMVDTYFSSLANPGLASDRELYQLYGDFIWGGMSLRSENSYETNNVDDLPGLPRDSLTTLSLDGSYYFNIVREDPDDMAWLGSPFVTFGAYRSEADRVNTPSGFVGYDTDNVSKRAYVGLGTSYQDWSWQFGYTRDEYEDDTNDTIDNSNDLFDLSASWNLSDRLFLSGGPQVNIFEDEDNHERTYDVNANFSLQADLIPDELKLSADYNLNLSSGSNDSSDRHLASGELEWIIIPARNNSIGISALLKGSVEKEDRNSDASFNNTRYETYGLFRFTAPISKGF